VIAGSRAVFLAKAAKRGYTLDQVSACIVSDDGMVVTVDETHPAYPHAKPGLGDMVAAGLAAVGITKERVSRLIGQPCGCDKRQAALNKLGKIVGIGTG
jgi:hypothetical protein